MSLNHSLKKLCYCNMVALLIEFIYQQKREVINDLPFFDYLSIYRRTLTCPLTYILSSVFTVLKSMVQVYVPS